MRGALGAAIAYSERPAAPRACPRDSKRRKRTTFESLRYQTPKNSRSILIPLPLPVPAWRKTSTTASPASMYSL